MLYVRIMPNVVQQADLWHVSIQFIRACHYGPFLSLLRNLVITDTYVYVAYAYLRILWLLLLVGVGVGGTRI